MEKNWPKDLKSFPKAKDKKKTTITTNKQTFDNTRKLWYLLLSSIRPLMPKIDSCRGDWTLCLILFLRYFHYYLYFWGSDLNTEKVLLNIYYRFQNQINLIRLSLEALWKISNFFVETTTVKYLFLKIAVSCFPIFRWRVMYFKLYFANKLNEKIMINKWESGDIFNGTFILNFYVLF